MTERPILFSAPMVRALLAGTKTQTRRIVKPQPPEDHAPLRVETICPTWIGKNGEERPGADCFGITTDDGEWCLPCRYGAPGDRLWVKETLTFVPEDPVSGQDDGGSHCYAADIPAGKRSANPYACSYLLPGDEEEGKPLPRRSVPSIHCPRWASRLTLEIAGVRVERLQAISEADAIAEGIVYSKHWEGYGDEAGRYFHCTDPRRSYEQLWEHINGAGSWDENPWVWVIEFRECTNQRDCP